MSRHSRIAHPGSHGRSQPGALPLTAAWQHRVARDGFEVLFVATEASGHRLRGHTAAVEDAEPWAVSYDIGVDGRWRTTEAHVRVSQRGGTSEVHLEADGAGHWLLDGRPAPHLDGCLDVDLESSACTNALPVRRLALDVGDRADAPAAYVRALDLAVERLEQVYTRVTDAGRHQRYDYESPAFGVACRLEYDEAGLVVDYPDLAVRAL